MTGRIELVGVCGAGAMGAGIAQLVAQAGAGVILFDVDPGALSAARTRLEQAVQGQVVKGRLSADQAAGILSRLSFADDLSALAGADLVIEAIVEDLAVKQSLFARLEGHVRPDAILASNTSSLPIARLARGLKRPDRFIGLHFFNPAPVMKLVEVVPGPVTDVAVIDRAEQAARSWGKIAVRAADVPGFIVNRVARPFYAEGFCALAEGAGSPERIDHLFRAAAGFRMGPLELTDLIGQDVNFAVARSVFDGYFGRTRFFPQRAQAALVDAGRLGRKSGSGVYQYGPDGVGPPPASPLPTVTPTAEAVAIAERLRAGEAGFFPLAGILVGWSDGRTARSLAAHHFMPVALLDWCDTGQGKAVGFAASDEAATAVAVQVITALGAEAHRLSDRPGLLVLRTLAQIANAAADAVLEQVADEAGIDAALRHGANYPMGPFAWADRLGRKRLVRVLRNIAEGTGAALYAPSEYLGRTS